jgi:hypothetical protein
VQASLGGKTAHRLQFAAMIEQIANGNINRKAQSRLVSFGIGLLLLYALLGVSDAPFHGDESTILYMANDWFILREQGVSALYYRTLPLNALAQELRLVNGTLAPFSYGLMLETAGVAQSALNDAWDWSADWWENQYYRHFPRPEVLFIGRWTSALALCLALALSFAAGRLLIGAPSAFLATLIAGLTPAVLLNARRAVFEGVAFLGAALIWYAAARLVAGKVRIGDWMLLGVACGLALAAKHTSLLLIAPIFIALLWYGRARLLRTLSRLALAATIMSALFLLLNPSWWSEPLHVPREVLQLRSATLTVQNELFGRPLRLHERLEALVAFPFGAPQYFEDTRYAWREWLADSIQGYERALQGVTWYAASPLVYLALLLGALTLRRARAGALLGIVLLGIGAALLLTNTLMWQRYYLLLTFPLTMLATLGLTRMVQYMRTFRRA